MKKAVTASLCLALTLGTGFTLHAGGVLETVDITAGTPSPISGHVLARVIGIRWDNRAIPVKYRVNDSTGPDVPNPLAPAAPVLTLADATTAMQASFDAWNSLRSSYIEMRIIGNTTNAGLRGFDFVNELTFRTPASFGAIASSPSVSLIADSTFVDGDDIDGDGDPDVSDAITVTADVDADGDLEFPAGFYKAGTILDNDVQFNTLPTGLRFTVGDAALDNNTRSVDLNTVATHEFGHSHGLAHSMDNQTSETDGDGATMFPFIDTGDPEAERQQRSLHTDDIAWSSYIYPEGSAKSGPGALQPGDVPFSKAFALITGEVQHGVLDQPIAGASVFAVGNKKEDRLVASGYSGSVQLSFNPLTGGLSFLPDPADGVLNGKYVIPVLPGNYSVGVEAVDGNPAAAGNISFTCQVGAFYGQQNFNEEFYNRHDDDEEARPGRSKNVHASAGRTTKNINIVTNDAFSLSSFGPLNAIGFVNSVPGRYYAVQIPASEIAAFAPGESILPHSALFETFVIDASVVPVFSEVMVTTGTLNPDGTASIDLANPLDKEERFVAQDGDFSPFFLKRPRMLGRQIRRGIERGDIQNLFLVLRIPTTTPFPGFAGQPPLVGLNVTGTIFGRSFTSVDDGVTFTPRTDLNFRFSLVLARTPD
jgi:hypothetical protein